MDNVRYVNLDEGLFGFFGGIDDDVSVEELTEAAELDDTDAIHELGRIYLDGIGVDQDFEMAAHWWSKSAEMGYSIGQLNMGLFYAKGCGVERNLVKAAEWCDKASRSGDEDAGSLSAFLKDMIDTLKKAETGNVEAQYKTASNYLYLSECLYQFGPEADFKQAFIWASKAAAADYADAYFLVGLAYDHGRGIEQDSIKAFEFFKKGCDLGSISCKHNLGCKYINGDGVAKDQAKGFKLVTEAAEGGDNQAMKTLGTLYQLGIACQDDIETACYWFEKSLELYYDPELENKLMLLRMTF